jgi:hypothetical protein
MTIGKAALAGKPAALAARIMQAASAIGAPFQTPDELRWVAEEAVDEVQARVAAMNQAGGLSAFNKAYKRYREQQLARAEKAQPYRLFLEQRFTATIVRDVAMSWRAI